MEEIWDVLLQTGPETLLLSPLHDQVRRINISWATCLFYFYRLDTLEFKPSKSQRKLVNRYVDIEMC